MKNPNRYIKNAELSRMIMDVCVFLGAIFGIYIISNATNLNTGFKFVDILILSGVAVLFGIDFVFLCFKLKKRKTEMKDRKESEFKTDEEDEEK